MGPVKAFHTLRTICSVLALTLLWGSAATAQTPPLPEASARQAVSYDDPPATWQGQAPAHISVVDGVSQAVTRLLEGQ